ncbi:MAG: cobalamin biosynthesis protein CobQ [Ruminococcus flavefaciens]|nr:cobalamin biosynthesis protein CobQ [Ruminococcus flavefaciens]MCM1231208.1 cobalamin biosynthesis protein CobQ [Ruminococcus flavefaciens]
MKKITIVTGHYGSGKTNLSVNLAVSASREGKSVAVVDLDLVNPYFRTADFREYFENMGIKLIAPDFANSNLDVPSIQFDIEQLAMNEDCLIIDVGGDDAGAFALGRFANALAQYREDTDMLYVINQRRYLTETVGETVTLMYEIESAARMKHTAIVNNTNLGRETTAEIISKSAGFAEKVSETTGLPLAFTTCPAEICELLDMPDIFPINVYVKPLWEL